MSLPATTPRSRLGEEHSGFVPVAGVDKALQLRISEHRLKVAGGACARRAMQLLILLGRRHRCSAAANPGRIITGSARELALGRHVLCLTLLLASAAVRSSSYSLPAPRVRTNLACRLDTASKINMSAPASRFPPGSVVAVTGANGFIGSHIVKQLLAKGYRVRAVVRDPTNASKVAHLKTFPHSEHVELAKGELNEADYQKAFAGAHAVIHTPRPTCIPRPIPTGTLCSPPSQVHSYAGGFVSSGDAGTLAALRAAVANKVQRVVITSSGGAFIHFPVPEGYKFTVNDVRTYLMLQRIAVR